MRSLSRIFRPPANRQNINVRDGVSTDTASQQDSESICEPSHSYGLDCISEGTEPILDIVAVHGLNGHHKKTWTAANGKNWLRDLLPDDLPNARIFSWGYDANTHDTSAMSHQYLHDHAKTLVSDLCLKRETTHALIHSNNAKEGTQRRLHAIKLSTYGIFFMGTPHQGGNGVALGKILVNIASIFVNGNNRLLQHLESNSEWLQSQLEQYATLSSSFITKYAFEEYETPTLLGKSLLVVPRYSAVVPGDVNAEAIVIHSNHTDMVKFGSRQNPGYKTIIGHIKIMLENIGNTVRERWQAENERNTISSKALQEVFHMIPESNPNFVGRKDDMKALQELLNTKVKKFTLYGLGGIGKTQLVVEFVNWVKHNRTDFSIIWLSASSTESFIETCTNLITKLCLPQRDKNEDSRETMKQYLSSNSSNKWLLIIDNADDSEVLFGINDRTRPIHGIAKFFPGFESGLTLFTTRDHKTAWDLSADRTRQIRDLSEYEATQLISNLLHTRATDVGIDEREVQRLVRELTCHPLAITQAAAYITVTNSSITKYLNLLQDPEPGATDLLSHEFRDDTTGKISAVATTWLISFEQLQRRCPAAIELLNFISQIEPRAIPFSLLPSPGTNEGKKFAIGMLSAYAFVTRQDDKELYNMHPLVHQTIGLWIQRRCQGQNVARSALTHMASVFPSVNHSNRSIWRTYLPHAIRIANDPTMLLVDKYPSLCLSIGKCLLIDGRSYESVKWLAKTEDLYHNLPETHPDRLASQHELARAYLAAGQVNKAVKLLEHVVAVRKETLDEAHPGRLTSQHTLARAYKKAGRVKLR